MLAKLSPGEFRDRFFITLASLRNGSTNLHDNIEMFITRFVVFEERTGTDAEITEFWKTVDVGDKDLSIFVEVDASFEFGSNKLHVSKDLANDPKAFSNIYFVVTYTMRWPSFSLTRWCRSGRSGRSWIRSQATGITPLVHLTLDHPHVDVSKLGGYPASQKFGLEL